MRSVLLLLVSVVVFGALIWFFCFIYAHYKQVNLRFERTYTQVENLIQERRYEEAYSQLLRLAKVAASCEQWQRILKKAYSLARSSNHYTVLSSLSEKACSAYPSIELFWALRVYSSLRSGSYSMVYEWAKTYLRDPVYEPLVQEALLASLWANEGEEVFFSRLEKEKDPVVLEHMGDILSSIAFYYNASLLYLKEGKSEDVRRIFNKISDKKSYTRSFAHLAYLARDWEWVIESLTYLEEEDVAMLSLLAEVYLLKRDYQNAEYVYQKIISDYPDALVTPYINLALIKLMAGQGDLALDVMKLGKEHFCENAEFIRYYAMILANTGREVQALKVLQPFLGKDEKLDLLAFSLTNKRKCQSCRALALWQMWRGSAHYSRELALLMLFEFSKFNLWHDFDLLARELPTVPDNEVCRFLAYKDFFFGKQNEALRKFFEGANFTNQHEALYNAGLVYYQQREFQKALGYFSQSYEQVPFKNLELFRLSPRERDYLANICYFKGNCQYYLGLNEEAKHSLKQSMEFCPHSAATLSCFYNLFPTR